MKVVHKRVYDDRDKAKVALALQMNEGNKRKTARELGIPLPTLRTWIRNWELDGYPEGMESVLPAEREDFVIVAEQIRWSMLEALQEKVDRRELNGKDLLFGIQMLTDKINVMTGQVTSRSEHIEVALPSPDELAKAMSKYIIKTIGDVAERNETIEDAQWEQVPQGTLPKGI